MTAQINTWTEFFEAVEAMRECQKEYFKTRSPVALSAAKRHEDRIDGCIKHRREEWAARKQPELIGGKRDA
jgi:hypothetical protein